MHLPKGLCFFAAILSFSIPALASDESEAISPKPEWKNLVLSSHNWYRAQYGARPLTWSDDLFYPGALQWAARCKYEWSPLSDYYGENIYFSSAGKDIDLAVSAWMEEARKYDYNHPGFSDATADFTQVVWKSTTQVACASANCPAGTIFPQPGTFTVCRYSPPGNYPDRYPQNVGRPI